MHGKHEQRGQAATQLLWGIEYRDIPHVYTYQLFTFRHQAQEEIERMARTGQLPNAIEKMRPVLLRVTLDRCDASEMDA